MVHIRCGHVRCLLVPFSQLGSEISSKLLVTRERHTHTHTETETETDIQRDRETDKEAEHLVSSHSLRRHRYDKRISGNIAEKNGEEMIYHFKACDLIHLHMAGMSTGGLSRSVASVHATLWTSTEQTHRKYITSRQTSPAHCVPARRGPTDDPQLWPYRPSQGP